MKLVERDVDTHLCHKMSSSSNCTPGELQAVYSLQKTKQKQKPSIIVKPVDKGCAIVLISRESYDQEVQTKIDDFFAKLNGDLTQSLKKDIDRFLESVFNNQMISKTNTQLGQVLNVLPKVHKTLLNPPGHLIVSCVGSLTELSIFIDHYLRPIVEKQPSYLRET